jgi:hypothetical protein
VTLSRGLVLLAVMLAAGAARAEDVPPSASAPLPPQAPMPSASQGGASAPTSLSDRTPDMVFDTAILQGMDKVTGRVMTIEAPVGSTVHFGTLEFIVRTCRKRPPEETPEAAAFLDIWEVRSGETAAGLFRGWMFASSPALSALEHPVYDIWEVDCADSKAKGSSPAKSP